MNSVDLEILTQLAQWLSDGQRATLVTVVKTWGSSPRPAGSMLAVRHDGRLVGSVSGGCVEDDLVERICNEGLAAQRPDIVTYGVPREESQRFGLPCGGTLQLVAEPVHDVEHVQALLRTIQAGRVIARSLDLRSGRIQLRPAGDEHKLEFDGAVLTTIFGPCFRLLIIGANHVSRYLAEMARALDYKVVVCDPREDYASSWDLGEVEVMLGMPDDVVSMIVPDARTAIVCLTHDPKLDDLALLEALKSDAFYVGALGSRRSNTQRRARLSMFDLTAGQIARLHGPIGLAIGSRTPPEIAISILAEMTAVRHGAMAQFEALAPASAENDL